MLLVFEIRTHLTNCSSKYICRKCVGKHHVFICKFDEKENEGLGWFHMFYCKLYKQLCLILTTKGVVPQEFFGHW